MVEFHTWGEVQTEPFTVAFSWKMSSSLVLLEATRKSHRVSIKTGTMLKFLALIKLPEYRMVTSCGGMDLGETLRLVLPDNLIIEPPGCFGELGRCGRGGLPLLH